MWCPGIPNGLHTTLPNGAVVTVELAVTDADVETDVVIVCEAEDDKDVVTDEDRDKLPVVETDEVALVVIVLLGDVI